MLQYKCVRESSARPLSFRLQTWVPISFASSLQPQDRLADGMIADHFGNGGIRIEALPGVKISLLAVGEAGKQKTWLAHRQIVEVLYVMPIGPQTFVTNERQHETKAGFKAAHISEFVGP